MPMNHQMREIDSDVVSTLCTNLEPYNTIRPEKFTRYGVKRGLRNADGTGVLAGITRLSNVHGYLLNEGEREPIQGRLSYRGIDLYDLLHGFESENRFGFGEVAFCCFRANCPLRSSFLISGRPSAKPVNCPKISPRT